jgi:hypothetical protein
MNSAGQLAMGCNDESLYNAERRQLIATLRQRRMYMVEGKVNEVCGLSMTCLCKSHFIASWGIIFQEEEM